MARHSPSTISSRSMPRAIRRVAAPTKRSRSPSRRMGMGAPGASALPAAAAPGCRRTPAGPARRRLRRDGLRRGPRAVRVGLGGRGLRVLGARRPGVLRGACPLCAHGAVVPAAAGASPCVPERVRPRRARPQRLRGTQERPAGIRGAGAALRALVGGGVLRHACESVRPGCAWCAQCSPAYPLRHGRRYPDTCPGTEFPRGQRQFLCHTRSPAGTPYASYCRHVRPLLAASVNPRPRDHALRTTILRLHPGGASRVSRGRMRRSCCWTDRPRRTGATVHEDKCAGVRSQSSGSSGLARPDRAASAASRPRTARPRPGSTSTAARPASRTRSACCRVHQAVPLGLRELVLVAPVPTAVRDRRRCPGSDPRSRPRRPNGRSGSSRFTYQFLNRQPGSQNSHTDHGSPGRASFSTPVPNQRPRGTRPRRRCSGCASGSSCDGVPSASTGLTHSVPGAIHTASSSSSSRTTVTGRRCGSARRRSRGSATGSDSPAPRTPPIRPLPLRLTAPSSAMRRY